MAKLFDIVNNEIQLVPEVLAVPAIEKLWKRDTSRNKVTAMKEIKYVTFYASLRKSNPYRDTPHSERAKLLKGDIFGSRSKWEPDEDVKTAIEKYKQLEKTRTFGLLESSFMACDKLEAYFRTIDLTLTDNFGKPIYSARDLSSNLKEVGNIITSLNKLEKQVDSEMAELEARGGNEVSYYEDPANIEKILKK